MSSRPRRPSAIAEESLLEPGFGPDRALMLHHFPRAVRPAIVALWAIDEAMGAVVMAATQPALAAIKLAWWAEALTRLDRAPPPPEPRLQAVATQLLPRRVTGDRLAAIERGWRALLDERIDADEAALRGTALFSIGAAVLESDDPVLDDAARLFALGDAVRRGHRSLEKDRDCCVASLSGRRAGRAVRPVTLAARLAGRDPEEIEGTPGRAFALIAHRLSGMVA